MGHIHENGYGDLSDGSWLIKAGKLKVGTGMYWLDYSSGQSFTKIQEALNKQYGKDSFITNSHGNRFYAWRNKK